MSAEVTPGYKRTEAGVIPEDWEVKPIGDLIVYTKGYAFRSSDYKRDGVRIIRVSDTTFDSIKSDNQIFISEHQSEKYSQWKLNEFDIIISTVGSKPPMYDSMVGKAVIVDRCVAGSLLNQNAVLIRNKEKLQSKQILILSNLRTKRYFSFIEGIFRGNANQASITLKDLFEFSTPLPQSTDEQNAIAGALSDIESLVSNLDQLIAKKRDIQQATMQQLLTGQRRLPGFSGEWVTTRFSEIVKHHSGNSTLIKGKLSSEQIHGYFPAYSASGQDVWCQTYEHEGQAIIVSAVGSRCGKAFRADGKWSAIANTHIVWPVAGKVTIDFLSLFLNDENFWLKSGSGQPFVLFKQSFSRPLSLPSLEEQSAIAHTLEDIASEIERLNFKREKLCAIKTGMAQSLLTGKIRLISEA